MIKKTFQYYFILFISVHILNAQSSGYVIKRLSLEDGLSQSSIYSITQDKQGFMWFTTEDGLNRYDGYNFTIYKNSSFDKNSLSENSVYSIAEGAPGTLWISTWSTGLNKFNTITDQFTRFVNIADDSLSLSSDIIYDVAVDNNGFVWIGTENGLNRLDTALNTFKHFHNNPIKNSIADNLVNEIEIDRSGNIWATGFYKGLSMYNPQADSFKVYSHNPDNAESLISNEIYSLKADKADSNIIWAGTINGGIERINSVSGEIDHFGNGFVPGIPNDRILTLETDYNGNVWVGTAISGLYVLSSNGKLLHKFVYDPNDHNCISQNSINSIYLSKSGVIWVGTNGAGINIINSKTKNFKLYRQSPDQESIISNSSLGGLMEDKNNNMWICGWNSGLTILDRKTNKTRIVQMNTKNNKGLNSNSVLMTFELRDNKIAITTGGNGVNIYDPRTDKFEYIKNIPGNNNSLADNYIMTGFEDNDGIVWLGFSDQGLDRWDRKKGTFQHFKHDKNDATSLAGDQVYTLFEDKYNDIWVSSQRAGLSRLNKKTFKFKRFVNDENNQHSLSSNDVMVLYQAKEGTLWVGTYGGGLNKFNYADNTFKSYKEVDGLPNNVVYGILEDDRGNLWLSTNKGISKFNPGTEEFRNYDVSDGLQSNEFNSSYCKTSDGEMFFGGINGLNSFFPDDIKDNTFIPPVLITNLQILNKNISVNEEFNGRRVLSKNITYTDQVELTYDDYVVSFEFAALNYTNSHKNRYAYKLDGLDKEWNYSGNRRFATYSNLPPGEYTFRVKGSNNDGIWNEAGASLKVIVIPAFWQTWWLRTIGLVLLITILIVYYKSRTKTIKDQNINLEEAVRIKTGEMEKLMEKMINQEKLATIGKISASIAHELRNPLGAVRQSVYFLKSKFSDVSDKLTKHLTIIDDELSVADRVIDDLLEMTRLKKINKEYTDLKILINKSIERSKLSKEIKTEINILPENQFLWVDQIHLEQVFVNLLINANQAMDGKGTICFTSSRSADDKYIQLVIEDSGIGIKQENLEKLFEPLYTSKAKGTGLGLSICKQIIEKHDGKINIYSEEGKGTKVNIMLPYKDNNTFSS